MGKIVVSDSKENILWHKNSRNVTILEYAKTKLVSKCGKEDGKNCPASYKMSKNGNKMGPS